MACNQDEQSSLALGFVIYKLDAKKNGHVSLVVKYISSGSVLRHNYNDVTVKVFQDNDDQNC